MRSLRRYVERAFSAGRRKSASRHIVNNDNKAPILAAVIVARNEEEFIGRCIASVLQAIKPFESSDVVLVDSHSTDRTVEIARSFPIRVIQLLQSAPLSPALGRRVGQHLTRSRYILFVDGDTVIEAAWAAQAIAALDQDQRVAAVGGRLKELYFHKGQLVGENPDRAPEAPDHLGGTAVYRRDPLDAVGSFNPFVSSYEEAELRERLKKAGFTITRLTVLLGTHHTGPVGSCLELKRRYRTGFLHGYGQVLRLSIRDRLFTRHARRLKRYLQFDALLALGIVGSLASLLTLDLTYVALWMSLCLLLTIAFMLRSRSLTKPFKLIMDWSFCAIPFVVGFLRTPPDPSRFDVNEVASRAGPDAATTGPPFINRRGA